MTPTMTPLRDIIATRAKRDRIEIGMKTADLRPLLVIVGILTFWACASQSSLAQADLLANASFSAGDNKVEASMRSEDPDDQTPPGVDRRDRVYYPDDTERPKPLLRKLFLNIVLDQKDIFTSPFRVNRHNAVQWLVPMAVTGALIASDTHIANAFENSSGQVRWGGRISDIGASYTLVPIVAGSYVYGAWRDNPKAREIGVLGTQSLLDSLIVVGVLKEVFRRNRPDEKNPGDFWGGGTSFPSGHAIQVWSIASLLDHEFKRKRIVGITAYSLAGIVSAARIAAQKHFASDVVAGGTMGWFIGRYVYDTHMSHLAHKHASLIPMIVPQADPQQRRYGVALVFNVAAGR
jgi:membrane-associated phospholipid phosphatase